MRNGTNDEFHPHFLLYRWSPAASRGCHTQSCCKDKQWSRIESTLPSSGSLEHHQQRKYALRKFLLNSEMMQSNLFFKLTDGVAGCVVYDIQLVTRSAVAFESALFVLADLRTGSRNQTFVGVCKQIMDRIINLWRFQTNFFNLTNKLNPILVLKCLLPKVKETFIIHKPAACMHFVI